VRAALAALTKYILHGSMSDFDTLSSRSLSADVEFLQSSGVDGGVLVEIMDLWLLLYRLVIMEVAVVVGISRGISRAFTMTDLNLILDESSPINLLSLLLYAPSLLPSSCTGEHTSLSTITS